MAKRQQDFQATEAKKKSKPHEYNYKPEQIGGFSSDKEKSYKDDDSQMKILSIPECKSVETKTGKVWSGFNMNLNEGYEDFNSFYNKDQTSFDKLLWFISSRKDSQEGKFKKLFPKKSSSNLPKNYFICTREVLVYIFSSVYKNKTKKVNKERDEDFLICATKFNDVIYLKKKNIEEKENIDEKKGESNDELKKIIYYGHKFEHNITKLKQHNPDSKSNRSVPNLNEQFYAVMNAHFDAQFDEYYLIFSAQMDAVDDSSSSKHFVEIKTNYELIRVGRKEKFRWKLLSWYLQCFIAGVPRLICGFRNVDGFVKEVEDFKVSALPGIANEDGAIWSLDECFESGANFLSYVKQNVVEDNPKIAYAFSLKPGETKFEKLKEEESFLPDWYINKVNASFNNRRRSIRR